MDLTIPDSKFVCVDYPGIVVNVDKMLETLGEEKNISKTYNDSSKRLELWFRSRDVGCKPLYGDRQLCCSLLLKVRRRKKKNVPPTSDLPPSSGVPPSSDLPHFEYDARLLGIVDLMYTFQSMSDFQYLPMVYQQSSGTYSSILSKVYITQLHNSLWMSEPSPLFLPPLLFSRFDRSVDYCYREPPQPRPGYEDAVPKLAPNIIGVSRKRRPHFTQFVYFSDKKIPTEPHQMAVKMMQQKRKTPGAMANVKKLFEEQPIWSRSALFAHTDPFFSLPDVCSVLPAVAYYFVNGPWRTMWVRFGFDPRLYPEMKIFQTLDVRLRRHWINDLIRVRAKRSSFDHSLFKTSLKSQSQPSVIQASTFASTGDSLESTSKSARNDLESTFRFKPGQMPAYRQLFYQLCFIEEPLVQSLIHANDGQETECTEKDGWCLRDTVEKCRSILAQCIRSIANPDLVSSESVQTSDTPQSRQKLGLELDCQEYVEEVPPGEEDDDDEEDEEEEAEDAAEDNLFATEGYEDDDDDDDYDET